MKVQWALCRFGLIYTVTYTVRFDAKQKYFSADSCRTEIRLQPGLFYMLAAGNDDKAVCVRAKNV